MKARNDVLKMAMMTKLDVESAKHNGILQNASGGNEQIMIDEYLKTGEKRVATLVGQQNWWPEEY